MYPVDKRERGLLGRQGADESFNVRVWALDVDFHSPRSIADPAAQVEALGQAIYIRAEPYPLHNPRDRNVPRLHRLTLVYVDTLHAYLIACQDSQPV
jgi:hypothetical protein